MSELSDKLQRGTLRREIGKMIVRNAAKRYEEIYGRPAIIKASSKAEAA